jgi:tetratricopeptide (TPR) repeat protein
MSSQTSEHVGNNIVKIVDGRSVFNGTGFFLEVNQNRYCITCHHCIYKLNEIFIERDKTKCSAEWVEEFSDMSKDIAVLKINDDYCNNIQVIKYARDAMALLPVSVWGFSSIDLEIFPQGSPVENGTLSSAPFSFKWKGENISGIQKWNKKPEVNVYVFKFLGKVDVGYSGAPICYTGNNNVIGIFTAKDNNYGYVIPIQTLLAKFEQGGMLIQSSPMVNMSHHIEKGNEFFITGDYHKAMENYRIVLNDQNYVAALNNKGLSLGKLKNFKEAIEYFDKVLAIDPNNINALNNKGLSLRDLQKYNEAIECYDKVLAIDPKNVYALNGKGIIHDSLQKYNDAIECYDKVLAIDSKHFNALVNRALAFDRLGRFEEALECYDKVLAIYPTNTTALNGKGFALFSFKEYAKATEYFDKVLEIDPRNIYAQRGKQEILKKITKRKY